MRDLFLDTIETPRGVFSVLFHDAGIYEICFPGRSPGEEASRRALPWPELAADLKRYLAGEKVCWGEYPLDDTAYTPFTRRILAVVRSIPYGEVLSYRDVAERAGFPLAWRAAGRAVGANRHPLLVPCHRVVRSDGSAGGFSGPAGWKEMLLEMERRAR